MNGDAKVWDSPNTVTCFSSIASRTADWVFGVARLISSREDHMGKYRPLFELKLASAIGFGQDLCADDVGGHEIRRELNALERNTQDVTQGFHQQCLASNPVPSK